MYAIISSPGGGDLLGDKNDNFHQTLISQGVKNGTLPTKETFCFRRELDKLIVIMCC